MAKPHDIPQDVWDAAVRQYHASEGLGFMDIASKLARMGYELVKAGA